MSNDDIIIIFHNGYISMIIIRFLNKLLEHV